jgi:hypothetical protein
MKDNGYETVQSWPRRESGAGYRCGPLAAGDRRSSLHHAWTLAVAGRSVNGKNFPKTGKSFPIGTNRDWRGLRPQRRSDTPRSAVARPQSGLVCCRVGLGPLPSDARSARVTLLCDAFRLIVPGIF